MNTPVYYYVSQPFKTLPSAEEQLYQVAWKPRAFVGLNITVNDGADAYEG